MAAFRRFDLSLIPSRSNKTLAGLATLAGGPPGTASGLHPTEADIIRWMNSHAPPDIDPDRCGFCKGPLGRIGEDALPVLTGVGKHLWLHRGCHGPWLEKRRATAISELTAPGTRHR